MVSTCCPWPASTRKAHAAGRQILHGIDRVAEVPAESVELPDDEHIVLPQGPTAAAETGDPDGNRQRPQEGRTARSAPEGAANSSSAPQVWAAGEPPGALDLSGRSGVSSAAATNPARDDRHRRLELGFRSGGAPVPSTPSTTVTSPRRGTVLCGRRTSTFRYTSPLGCGIVTFTCIDGSPRG